MSRRRRKSPLRVWAPVVVWVIAIAVILTMPREDIDVLAPVVGFPTALIAHLVAFLVLGFLLGRALFAIGRSALLHFLGAFVACLVLGVLLAGVQAFLPGREAMLLDIGANGAGSGAGLWLATVARTRQDRKRPRR